jgi:surface antigen
MKRVLPFAVVMALLALGACARMDALGPSSYAAVPPADPTVAATPTEQFASATILDFLSPTAVPRLSDQEKAEAASAQYYALQFGRPGAPRQWSGNTGASGTVTVGPFVKVNERDCRDFTHTVTIANAQYARAGTACRELGGDWQVVATN